VNALHLIALVSPTVLLATLAARAGVWKAKLQGRIDSLEQRINQHQSDLHNIGTALRRRAD
jgi:DNA anti-recombination protein RmuC